VEYWTAKRADYLSAEKGTINKVDVDLTVALCFPNSYYVGMSNLGLHTLYRYINQQDNIKAERAFFDRDTRPETIETGRSLQDFSCVGFSVSYELDYENLLSMLRLSKIPLLSSERTERHPLVFAGGFVTFFNGRPLFPFVDFLFLGECESTIQNVLDLLVSYPRTLSKKELLETLSHIDGVYVPGISTQYVPLIMPDINLYETHSSIITPFTEFKNMNLVEIARGCFHSCRFCVSGHVYKTTRVRTAQSVIAACEDGLRYTNKVGMIAGAPSDYPHLKEILEYIEKQGIEISFSSLRASSISDELLDVLARQGKESLTLAPETGSEELRASISKLIANKVFIDIAHRAKKKNFKKLKLYIMIGLPGESDQNCVETVDFIKVMSQILPVRVSMTPFIPKPGTPFQDHILIEKALLKERIRFFRKHLIGKNISLQFDGVRTAEKQALFAKGDERLLEYFV
jgi:radical SAM superfamily enzyme YgiQ (UPF0313 family)